MAPTASMAPDPRLYGRRRPAQPTSATVLVLLLLYCCFPTGNAIHHMKRRPIQYVSQRGESRPLSIVNMCKDIIYPAIATQAGTPPSSQGFQLTSGNIRNFTVSPDWQGRVWARTNCSFNAAGTGPSNNGGYNGGGSACTTGDCGGIINCAGSGQPPATLAEFTLSSASQQTFYDISLVDGYNIPVGIVSLYPESGNPLLTEIPPNLTNPVCIGTASLLAAEGSTADANLGTNASYPIPLDQSETFSDVEGWCPWDLQLSPPTKPGDGVYPYPDDSIQRPLFNPCYSACAKYGHASDCCSGSYDSPNVCKPSLYSQDAKKVCPDAYSYAFDDQTSTFIIPSGGGFQVIFCPPGRSTIILSTLSAELHELAEYGHVTSQVMADLQNATYINSKSSGHKYKSIDQAMLWSIILALLIYFC